jgi:hypothetical protein
VLKLDFCVLERADTRATLNETAEMDECHYSERPMCQQFRFASEGQSRSSRLLAERSPVCKHRLCLFGSNAVVMSRAAGSDDFHQWPRVVPARLPVREAERKPTMARPRC